MKKQENEVRKIFIKIRMNEDELKRVKKHKEQTTERSLSEYMRNVSMQKPVTVKYRNQSLLVLYSFLQAGTLAQLDFYGAFNAHF